MVRRLTTKELIAESLHELAAHKPVDKITIKEISDNCGVSTTTFYNHFLDKYDLIAWTYNRLMEEIFFDFADGTETWDQALLDFLVVLDNDRTFYANMIKHTDGAGSFVQATHLRSIELLKTIVRGIAQEGYDDELDFNVEMYLRGAMLCNEDWFTNRRRSKEQVAAYLYRAVPPKLQPYLWGDGQQPAAG